MLCRVFLFEGSSRPCKVDLSASLPPRPSPASVNVRVTIMVRVQPT